MTNDARDKLYTILAAIPAGRVISYGHLAELAGLPRRARWAGQLLHGLPADTRLPWHRVVNAQGKISLPAPHNQLQRERLLAEGVEVSASMRIDMKRFGWN